LRFLSLLVNGGNDDRVERVRACDLLHPLRHEFLALGVELVDLRL
jgi:hypothetical protein